MLLNKHSMTGRIMLVTAMVCSSGSVAGQHDRPSAIWYFPGAAWQPAKNIRLVGELGYNHYFRMGLIFPQAFITVHKHIVLNPAYIYAVQKRDGRPTVQEHYLMNAIIIQSLGKYVIIDDRNMLWNRFTTGLAARHYYRNRLRVAYSFPAWGHPMRLYAYNEVFYLFNRDEVARNRPAVGISSDLAKKLNVDITYIRQWDRYAGKLHLFFITGIWQW